MRWKSVNTSSFDAEQRRFERARKSGDAIQGGRGSIHDLFREQAASDLEGFEEPQRGRWVRDLGDGAFQVFTLVAMKGTTYCPEYGVSLDYVPVVRASSTRFHRTPKAAEADLFEACYGGERPPTITYFTEAGPPATTWWIRSDVAALWERTRPRAEAFWQATRTTAGVLAKALEQAQDDSFLIRAKKPLMVAAFAAARLGDRSQAEALLGRHLAHAYTRDVERERLPAALEKVLSRKP